MLAGQWRAPTWAPSDTQGPARLNDLTTLSWRRATIQNGPPPALRATTPAPPGSAAARASERANQLSGATGRRPEAPDGSLGQMGRPGWLVGSPRHPARPGGLAPVGAHLRTALQIKRARRDPPTSQAGLICLAGPRARGAFLRPSYSAPSRGHPERMGANIGLAGRALGAHLLRRPSLVACRRQFGANFAIKFPRRRRASFACGHELDTCRRIRGGGRANFIH